MKDHPIHHPTEASSTHTRGRSNHPNRILVVDDDDNLRMLSAEVLARSGYKVDTAEDGAAGWQALHADSYDLLITDNNMPKMTGVQLVGKLRAARMALPILMATGGLPKDEFMRNSWLQPFATLLKPYSIPELLEIVKEVLRPNDGARLQIAPPSTWQDQPSTPGS